jgi:hypothetical protein
MEMDGQMVASESIIDWMELDGKTALAAAALRITPATLSLIAEIDEFKGAWRAIGRLAPDRLTSLRRVATIESIGSSTRIDGARLSNLEVEKLLSTLQLATFATRDEQEVAGYAGHANRVRPRAEHRGHRKPHPPTPSRPAHPFPE